MQDPAVKQPEAEQIEALGRTERSDSPKGLPGRREVGPPESPARGARGIGEPGRSGRHSLKCVICNHPDRAAIEFDFLNWRNPGDLVKGYRFRGLSTIYRHAHATGLFAKRRLNLRFAMERIVERVNEVPVTANAVIRAARAIARINDSGEWIDPPSRLIVTHINLDSADASAPVGAGLALPAPAQQANAPRGTGSSRLAPRRRDTTKITAGSARSSSSGRQAGQGEIPDIAARDASASLATSHSTLATVFEEELLDEPSDSASAELPRIDGKPAPPEIILQLTPEFGSAVQERRRALEADRQARVASASGSGGFTPPAPAQSMVPSPSTSTQSVDPELARLGGRSRRAAVPSPQEEQSVASSPSALPEAAFDQPAPVSSAPSPARGTRAGMDGQSVASSPTSLPQAALLNSAPSALPHPAAAENNVADDNQNVAMPSSSLPLAQSSPAAAGGEQASLEEPARSAERSASRATDHGSRNTSFSFLPPAARRIGSSGSANPPFPFTPEPLRRWKPRRRF